MRSPYLKGVILCDEGSLGKTYEALLILAQLWYASNAKIALIVPTPLLGQWVDVIEPHFSLPFKVVYTNTLFHAQNAPDAENPFVYEGIVLTTYDIAAAQSEYLAAVPWNTVLFEEAHHLRRIWTGANTSAAAIREAVKKAFKILLTATPMQNSIMDIYGLIAIIDATVFPDEKSFYQRYFRKPENYFELSERVSKYYFRTTRAEVAQYVNIPERLPVTVEFTVSDKEQKLYDLLSAYVDKSGVHAFPKMNRYDLALLLFRTFSSSTFALERTLRGICKRLETLHAAQPDNVALTKELHEVRVMHRLAASIKHNAKAKELQAALQTGFTKLKELGAQQKALVFTENRATQEYLYKLLNNSGYKGKVLTFHGGTSRDYNRILQFRDKAKILIATDLAAEGFNLEFCSFVINYDLPYNTLTVEQRINRCHRQGADIGRTHRQLSQSRQLCRCAYAGADQQTHSAIQWRFWFIRRNDGRFWCRCTRQFNANT